MLLLCRILSRVSARQRMTFAVQILSEVEAATRHLAMTGRCHPAFGDGSLMARCHQLFPPQEPMACDQDFLGSMIVACEALLQHSRP